MALWRLYYHIVWATRDRLPLIAPTIENELFGFMRGKAHALGGIVHAVGGIEDHVHLIATIPPSISISSFVANMKGSSSHHLTHGITNPVTPFGWQQGYGVFSMGGRQLDRAVKYVLEQKEHHATRTTIPALEQVDQGTRR